MDPVQLRNYIVDPVLKELNMYSLQASMLLLGTMAQESEMGKYIHQIKGPALGVYQMEPDTFDDIKNNYLTYRPAIEVMVVNKDANFPPPTQMMYDLKLATQMARIHYYRVPGRLPAYNKPEDLGAYWKKYYNTPKGRGTVNEFVANFKKHRLFELY